MDDVFSRLFFCHHLTMQHWLVLSCFKAINMKNYFLGGLTPLMRKSGKLCAVNNVDKTHLGFLVIP